MRALKYGLPVIVISGLGLWFYKTTNLSASSATVQTDVEKTKSTSNENVNRDVASLKPSPDPLPSSHTAVLATTASEKKTDILTTEQVTTLKNFKVIHGKVFLSDKDKEMKKQIFADAALLKNLQALLVDPMVAPMGSDLYVQRMQAIDLLIDASVDGKSAEATAAILSIIEDKQVEDLKLSVESRQGLAEVKAEFLYTWTAKMPNQVDAVQHAIAGPVTAKIWQNAQAAQEQNRIESSTLNR
jgi:hypothetical protein